MDLLSWSIHSKGHCKPVLSTVDTFNPHRVARMLITMDQSSSERCKIQNFLMNPSSTHIFSLNECNWISFHRLYFLVKKNGANDDKEKRANQPSLKKSKSDFSLTKVIIFLKKEKTVPAQKSEVAQNFWSLFTVSLFVKNPFFSHLLSWSHRNIDLFDFELKKKQLLLVFSRKADFFHSSDSSATKIRFRAREMKLVKGFAGPEILESWIFIEDNGTYDISNYKCEHMDGYYVGYTGSG